MQSHATALIIEHEHRLQLHASVQATLYAVRRRYWSVDCRSQVCSVIKKDEITTLHSRWSDCGPFLLKEKRHYNRKQIKTYIAVFVCFAIKVVHLELISDFFIEAFIFRDLSHDTQYVVISTQTTQRILSGRTMNSKNFKIYSGRKIIERRLLNFWPRDQSSGILYHKGLPTSKAFGKPRWNRLSIILSK